MIIQADVCVCDECGHRWLPAGSTPKRCASCKSSKWNRGTEEIAPTSFNDPAREERKQSRRERKAALAEKVKESLPEKAAFESPISDIVRATNLAAFKAIEEHRSTCQHPAKSRTPGSEPKCIDCGKRLKAGVWV